MPFCLRTVGGYNTNTTLTLNLRQKNSFLYGLPSIYATKKSLVVLQIWNFEPQSHRPIWKTESGLERPQTKEGGRGGGKVLIYSGSLWSFVSKGGTLKHKRQQDQYPLYKRPVTLVQLKTKDKNQISLVAGNRNDI